MAKQKRSKYNSTPTVVNGVRFDSKAESKRYIELKQMEAQGTIVNLELQPKFYFIVNGKKLPRTWYQGDFRYVDVETNEVVVEDVKSPATITPMYRLKKKLMWALYDIDIKEVGVARES